MDAHDQASALRAKVNRQEGQDQDGVDVLHLPPRSEKHGSSTRRQQKETIQSGKFHIWITRGIVLAFLCLLVAIAFYFSSYFDLDTNLKKDTDRLIEIIR